MKLKKTLKPIVAINAGVLSLFLFTQNCGRVAVQDHVELPSLKATPLSVSVSSELVIPVNLNEQTEFTIPTLTGSAAITSISFAANAEVLATRSEMQGTLSIEASTWAVTYNPPVGLIGQDRSLLYLIGSDGSEMAVKVLFNVSDPDTSGFPELNALVYGSSADDRRYLQNKLSGYAPPGMSEIFNKWGRFAGTKWFASAAAIKVPAAISYCKTGINPATGLFNPGVGPGGVAIDPGSLGDCVADPDHVASAWNLRPSPDRIACAANSGVLTGFVSPLNFEYYEHEAVVTSPSGDDDSVGLVIAFQRESNGTTHTLAASRTQGGNHPSLGWGIVYYKSYVDAAGKQKTSFKVFGGSTTTDGKSVGGVTSRWGNQFSKIKVIRSGNIVTALASKWGSTGLEDDSRITVDLASASLGLTMFKGAQPYGYLSYSQIGSEFRDVKFSTGQPETYIYDLPNKIVYEKQPSGVYTRRRDLDAFTHIGAPRVVGNPDTGNKFQLNENKTFRLLN